MLAFGDLHLGRSASAVPGDPPEASTQFTWKRLVDHAIANDIDALLLLGDIVDQDNRYFEAVGPLLSGFEKLGRQGIQVYLVSGNHDFEVLAQIATPGAAGGQHLAHVHLLGRTGKWEMKTFQKEDLSLQIAGWSFPGRHVPGSPMQDFNEISRKRDPDRPLIGLLHCDVDVRESPYAPVSLNELIHTDADAWLLGHVHKPGALNVSDPAIWYSGSPHAMSAKETGMHGPLLITVRGKSDLEIQPLPLSPVRYETIKLDVSQATDEESVRNLITYALHENARELDGELEHVSHIVFDMDLKGEHAESRKLEAWTAKVNEDLVMPAAGGTILSVRKITNLVRPAVEDLQALAGESSPAGLLASAILTLKDGGTNPFLEELARQWKSVFAELTRSGTYLPLQHHGRVPEDVDREFRKYANQECNRLLNELISQREPIN